jgi:hypothetical protein
MKQSTRMGEGAFKLSKFFNRYAGHPSDNRDVISCIREGDGGIRPFSFNALPNINSASVTRAFAPLIARVAMYRDLGPPDNLSRLVGSGAVDFLPAF